MSGQPLPVSAVIPCFRCGATIRRAVESALAQTRPPAEIIVVDDASGDGSLDALAGLAGAAPVVRLTLPTNRGPASARNAGWAAAGQPYLAFLDADDAWHPRKLELQYQWMKAHPESVLTGHTVIDAAGKDKARELVLGRAVEVGAARLLVSNRFQTTSAMLQRGVAQRFADGKRYCEDYLLWLEIVLAGGRAHYLDIPLAWRFKPVYGTTGASGRLWDMERGELDALARVRRAGLLSALGYGAAAAWSFAKFVRRFMLPVAPR